LRTTFLGGGHGFNGAEPVFVEPLVGVEFTTPELLEPPFVEVARFEVLLVVFAELVVFPAMGLSGVGEIVQSG
jgi:hypothetical protein